MMRMDEARVLLGFPPSFSPTPSQVKAAYKRKVWQAHPDLFPSHEKSHAEMRFKLISEAYTCLRSGARANCPNSTYRTQVVRTGVIMTHGGRRNHTLIGIPFLFITLGTVALAGSMATRYYNQTVKNAEDSIGHLIEFAVSIGFTSLYYQGLSYAEAGMSISQSVPSLTIQNYQDHATLLSYFFYYKVTDDSDVC